MIVLQKLNDITYILIRDDTYNISINSYVSSRILNFYRTTYPLMSIVVLGEEE